MIQPVSERSAAERVGLAEDVHHGVPVDAVGRRVLGIAKSLVAVPETYADRQVPPAGCRADAAGHDAAPWIPHAAGWRWRWGAGHGRLSAAAACDGRAALRYACYALGNGGHADARAAIECVGTGDAAATAGAGARPAECVDGAVSRAAAAAHGGRSSADASWHACSGTWPLWRRSVHEPRPLCATSREDHFGAGRSSTRGVGRRHVGRAVSSHGG